MSERCCDAVECRAEDICRALSIHTQKITDSCRDKDCIEDLRVYLTRESQSILDAAGTAKVRSAELIYTAIDVSPVAFHRNHYTVDLTFYYKVLADAAVAPFRPAAVCGLALFSKRAVLCGENSGAHVFRSDSAGTTGGSIPTAVVEVIATNSRWKIIGEILDSSKSPTLSQVESVGLFLPVHCSLRSGVECGRMVSRSIGGNAAVLLRSSARYARSARNAKNTDLTMFFKRAHLPYE